METSVRSEPASDAIEEIWGPQPKQAAFIRCPADDVGFGGARGGGKSDAVPADFADHEEKYGEAAIGLALRRERTQLVELIERSRQLLAPIGFKWHEQDKYFRGPKGGRLRFAYLERDSDADAYQGHSYTRVYPEEMGTFPSEAPINKMMGTLRSGHGVPCQMKGTCNPGGAGHQWVKSRYGIGGKIDQIVCREFEFENPWTRKKIKKTRVFIPSKVTDNRFLGDDYIANLYQVGSPALVKAWLEGDWDVVEGAFFDCWSKERHVISPFSIPRDWLRFRSADWGSARPFSVGWWTVAGDDTRIGRNGQIFTGGDPAHQADPAGGVLIPRGALVRYREWYGCVPGQPNTGLKLTAEAVARGILEREAPDEARRIAYSVLDPAAFAQDGGPSLAERMAREKLLFRPADNKRVAQKGAMGGWDQMRARLVGDERPMIFTFSTCVDSIRTIPALQHDTARPEDLDTESEDHAADEWRYACMSRPWVRASKAAQKSKQPWGSVVLPGPPVSPSGVRIRI